MHSQNLFTKYIFIQHFSCFIQEGCSKYHVHRAGKLTSLRQVSLSFLQVFLLCFCLMLYWEIAFIFFFLPPVFGLVGFSFDFHDYIFIASS